MITENQSDGVGALSVRIDVIDRTNRCRSLVTVADRRLVVRPERCEPLHLECGKSFGTSLCLGGFFDGTGRCRGLLGLTRLTFATAGQGSTGDKRHTRQENGTGGARWCHGPMVDEESVCSRGI